MILNRLEYFIFILVEFVLYRLSFVFDFYAFDQLKEKLELLYQHGPPKYEKRASI